ncbi:hypothetical protein FRB96_000357 [Tulasnella sp. 330]|nr:hypothetical protein FRB96_000357 [Tulasnella sp. 330]KAG8885013.1 hypothetical protein FRB97_002520 [Tulasnella sp. 331]
MVTPPTSYADRAKTTRAPSSAKTINGQTPSANQTPAEGSQNSLSVSQDPTAEADKTKTSSGLVSTVNGIHPSPAEMPSNAAGPGEAAQTPSTSSNPTFISTDAITGKTVPVSVLLPQKQNVWVARKEQMTAGRSGSQTAAANDQNLKSPLTTSQPHSSAQPEPSSSAVIPSLPNSQDNRSFKPSQDITNSRGQPSRPAKKINPKSTPRPVAPAAHSEVPIAAAPPDFAASADWPAPIEAVNPLNASAVPLSSQRDDHTDDAPPVAERAHSRESSSTGTASHGKKTQWKPIPPSELQAAMDAVTTGPSSPRQGGGSSGRGRRVGGGGPIPDDRRNGNGSTYGASRSSGHASKMSSLANSPSRFNPPALPSSQIPQAPMVNLPSHAPRQTLSMPYGPGQGNGQRSHPHSPLSRSPYLHPQSNTRQNSPRIGGSAHYSPSNSQYRQMNYQSQPPVRHSLPPNPSYPVPPIIPPAPPKKKVLRPSPSKSQAVGGDIPQLPPGDVTCAPVFGSIQPDSEVGLGLSVNEDGDFEAKTASPRGGEAEIDNDTAIIRWHERERVETEAERILKVEGKYGIGVKPVLPRKTESEAEGDIVKMAYDETSNPVDISSEVPEVESVSQDVDTMEPMRSPKHKWSFGSFDGLSSAPSSTRSHIPSYGDGSSHSSPGENGEMNGYRYEGRGSGGSPPSSYGNRHLNDDRRGPNIEGGQYAAPFESGMNGYGPRGTGGRRQGRGSRGGLSGGYGGHRGGQGYSQRGAMLVNGSYRGGPYTAPPVPPPISTAYPQPTHAPQPPYDPGMALTYPPPMGTVEYQSMDPYGMQLPMPPPTPSGSQPPLSAMENPYSPHPLQPPYHPYMFAPSTPSGYYAPYPYMAPYAATPIPINYAPQVYPPPTAMQAPPVPMPLTTPGYMLDPSRFYLLGQVEYYFSVQNFLSDVFLRRQMDSEGWIDIHVIASFPRVRQLTPDASLVRDVMNLSTYIEVSPEGDKCRMANGQWEPFVLPGAAPHHSSYQSQPANQDGTQSDTLVHHIPVVAVESQHSGVLADSGMNSGATHQNPMALEAPPTAE